MEIRRHSLYLFLVFVLVAGLPSVTLAAESSSIQLQNNDKLGQLHVLIDGRKAFTYQYTSWLDLPHIYPLWSSSGKNLLVQQNEPYPHHRAFYFGDTVRLNGGRLVSIYNALYSGQKIGTNTYGPPFRDHIRHRKFVRLEAEDNTAVIEANSTWEMDGNIPILDEKRLMVIQSLEEGEYFIDITYTLTAAYGDVEFVSDDVHYAWPFLRIHPNFSGQNGGTIISDSGVQGEEATNMKVALWMDYSNTVEGITEGVSVFQKPDGLDHRWLTREYGIFGPRRPDNLSGKPFVLTKGEFLTQCVGIFVHNGDAKSGHVAEHFSSYISKTSTNLLKSHSKY
ncbi:DUF6807 family protein [Acidobacteriota bacterium]